jgi:hypothetical protein
MINTYSKFYYDLTILSSNKYLDFDEGAGALVAQVVPGTYTLEDLAQAVEDALNEAGSFQYTVTTNRASRLITIASTGPTDYLAATGTNVVLGASAFPTLGYPATDVFNSTSFVSSTAIGSVYSPQYKLQDFVDQEDSRKNRDATGSKSASGKVELQSFGIDRFFEFSIKFATNIYQPAGGPILNKSSGVQDLRDFMQWLMDKNYVEFMPDSATPNTYYRVVLEQAPGSNEGSGYKLQEQYGRGLAGYFESGILTFRIIED